MVFYGVYGVYRALKIVKKNRIEKIMAPKNRGGQKLNKKTTKCYKG